MPSEKGAIASLFERLGQWEQAGELSPLAKHHAQSLLIDFIRLQTQTSQRLASSSTFVEIAESLAKDILPSGQFFSVNLFNLNSAGDIEGLTCVALANRHTAFPLEFVMDIPLSQIADLYAPVFEKGEAVYIPDTTEYPLLRIEFDDKVVKSYIIFPMRSQGRTIGIINLNSVRGPIEPTPFQMEWYRSLVDIATSQVQLHNLIVEATSSQDLSERQAQVFNQLMAGQSFKDMAQIIAHYLLPQKGKSLAIMELVYSGSQVSHWIVRAVANRNQLLDWDIESELRWQDLGAGVQAEMLDGESVIIEDSDLLSHDFAGEYFYEWLHARGVNSGFSVTISNGRIPTGIMIIMSSNKRAFGREEMNAFQNVGEMVGALSEVRVLSEVTSKARGIIDELLMANRLVTTASSIAYMAQAVVYTLGKQFAASVITLFDTPIKADTTPTAHYAVALATTVNVFDFVERPPVFIPADEQMKRLFSGLPVIIEEFEGLITDQMRQQFDLPPLAWLGAIGLRVGDDLIGTLSLLGVREHVFTEEELSAYTSVADQIGLTIRGRQLLEETRTAQEFASRLTQANQAIASAEDYTQMTQLLMPLMPAEITAIGLGFFDRTLMIDDMPKAFNFLLLTTREQTLLSDASDVFTTEDNLEAVRRLIEILLSGEFATVEDLRPPYVPNIKNTTNYFLENKVHSTIHIGLRVGMRLLGVMTLGKAVGVTIPAIQHDNFLAIADQLALTIENRRLLNDTKITAESLATQVRALRIINDLATELNALRDEETIMEKTARALVDAVNVDHVGISLLSETGDKATVVCEYPKFGTLGATFSAKDDAFQRKLREQAQPIVINNIGTSTEISSETRILLQTSDIKSIALVPLMDARMGFIGSVGLDLYDDKRVFTPAMLDFARTITAQMAVTLQNVRLLQNTRRQARQMEAIAGFSQAIQAVLDVHELLLEAVQNIQQIIATDAINIVMFDASSNIWRRVAYSDGGKAYVNLNEDTPIPMENTTGGQVVTTKRMFSANDLTKTAYRFTFDDTMKSAISLPLLVRGASIGVVEVGNTKENAYSQTDSAIFQQLVSQMSIGLENAETYSQSQRLAKTKALVNEISGQLQQQTDLDQILTITLTELGKALGAKRARIRLMTGDES